jgi:isoaspartyl peptidase/L-asparaginase-like protein (Ntn-hydrolase superfamily)
MPVPKSNWIAKSQQMMYPIEMQAIGMSNQANAQIAQSIERTGQQMQEIQLKKQAFQEHHQRTMMMQAAENQKMALQDRAMLQEATKIDLERQRIQLQREAQTTKEFQTTIGTVSRDEHGNIRVAHPGAGSVILMMTKALETLMFSTIPPWSGYERFNGYTMKTRH